MEVRATKLYYIVYSNNKLFSVCWLMQDIKVGTLQEKKPGYVKTIVCNYRCLYSPHDTSNKEFYLLNLNISFKKNNELLVKRK